MLLTLVLAAIVCEYKGDDWEKRVRTAFYSIRHDSIPAYTTTFTDEKGIPFVHYAALGTVHAGDQYNPTIVCNYAIDYYQLAEEKQDAAAKFKFNNCVAWLADHLEYKNNYACYTFNWQQPFYDSVGVPWTSGMTSGRAIEAFTAAYQLDHSTKWLEYARSLLRGFYQLIDSGGFTYKEQPGYWYEEYADSRKHTPRVLDGHIFAMLGVNKFRQATNSDSAAFIFQQGIASLKVHLPGYDVGDGWSYYDAYQKRSDKQYHMILTGMMKDLWDITGDPVFKEYYRKWNAPLVKPYVYRIFKEGNRSGLVLYFLLSTVIWLLLFFVLKAKTLVQL